MGVLGPLPRPQPYCLYKKIVLGTLETFLLSSGPQLEKKIALGM